MSLKALLFSLGCLLAWLVLLPAYLIGGGLVLFAYALGAELLSSLVGPDKVALDPSAAREMANRMCLNVGAQRAT